MAWGGGWWGDGGGIDLGGVPHGRWETSGWVRVAKSATLIGIGAQKSLITTRLQLTWQLVQAPDSPVGGTSSLPPSLQFWPRLAGWSRDGG